MTPKGSRFVATGGARRGAARGAEPVDRDRLLIRSRPDGAKEFSSSRASWETILRPCRGGDHTLSIFSTGCVRLRRSFTRGYRPSPRRGEMGAIDREIDRLVYELYGLTEEGFRIVDGPLTDGRSSECRYRSTSPMTTSMLPTMAATSASRQLVQTCWVMERLQNDGPRALTRAGMAEPSPWT